MKSFLLILALTYTNMSFAYEELRWKVVNRFPLLSDNSFIELEKIPTDKDIHENNILSNIINSDLRHLDWLKNTAWNSEEQIYEPRLISPENSITLTSTIIGNDCNWVIYENDFKTITKEQASCSTSPSIPIKLDFSYSVELQSSDGKILALNKSIHPSRKLIVTLGDSFASGEGNPDYPTVFNNNFDHIQHDWAIDPKSNSLPKKLIKKSAQWFDSSCHRSLLSWPALSAMKQAILDPHQVIQFASFACSGAEVYDGILKPQQQPPGLSSDSKSVLKYSQVQALTKLLCLNQQIKSESIKLAPTQNGPRDKQILFGNFTIEWCDQPLTVDQLYLQIGGNDAGFSGIVSWSIYPNLLPYKSKFGRRHAKNLAKQVNQKIKSEMKPIEPSVANEKGIQQIPTLYKHVQLALSKINITPDKVLLMLYPDPSPKATGIEEFDEGNELKQCNSRTRDGNKPFQKLIYYKINSSGFFTRFLRNDNAFMGLIPKRMQQLSKEFVYPLKEVQKTSAKDLGWRVIDPQPAFNNHGFCASSTLCSTSPKKCLEADRVRWEWSESEGVESNSPPFVLSRFKAYDNDRKRGMRYAVDSLLTSARLDPNGKLLDDWMFSTAHPTANIHGLIADLLYTTSERKDH